MSRDYEGSCAAPIAEFTRAGPSVRTGSEPSELKAIGANRIAPGRLAMPAFPLPIRTSRYRKALTEAGCEKDLH